MLDEVFTDDVVYLPSPWAATAARPGFVAGLLGGES